MVRNAILAAAILAAAVLPGCAEPEGATRMLGAVAYQDAFLAANEVMSQYYTVASAKLDSGEIKSAPKFVPAGGGDSDQFFPASPTRQVATIRLRRAGGEVEAWASVAVQRQTSEAQRQLARQEAAYDTSAGKTPAELEAATTAEQNQGWRTERYAHDIEFKMLNDLYDRLHKSAK
jgi:hypothetical protein